MYYVNWIQAYSSYTVTKVANGGVKAVSLASDTTHSSKILMTYAAYLMYTEYSHSA